MKRLWVLTMATFAPFTWRLTITIEFTCPFAGQLEKTYAVPGALFSVNGATEEGVEGLFCRNERLVCRFNTEFGPMLVVLVGALIVASIETVWPGPRSPYKVEQYNDHSIGLNRGDEIGRFLLGSTVICCFPKGAVELNPELKVGSKIRLGEKFGQSTLRKYFKEVLEESTFTTSKDIE